MINSNTRTSAARVATAIETLITLGNTILGLSAQANTNGINCDKLSGQINAMNTILQKHLLQYHDHDQDQKRDRAGKLNNDNSNNNSNSNSLCNRNSNDIVSRMGSINSRSRKMRIQVHLEYGPAVLISLDGLKACLGECCAFVTNMASLSHTSGSRVEKYQSLVDDLYVDLLRSCFLFVGDLHTEIHPLWLITNINMSENEIEIENNMNVTSPRSSYMPSAPQHPPTYDQSNHAHVDVDEESLQCFQVPKSMKAAPIQSSNPSFSSRSLATSPTSSNRAHSYENFAVTATATVVADPTSDVFVAVSEKHGDSATNHASNDITPTARTPIPLLNRVIRPSDVASIIQLMRDNPYEEDIISKACNILYDMNTETSQWNIATNGGIEVIVQAMKDHLKSAHVQENACRALQNISRNHQNKMKVGACGAIEMIIEGMKNHPKSTQVQQSACCALVNISINDDNQVRIAACGGIEMILQAMKEHLKNAEVQESACWVLLHISSIDGNEVKIANCGGIELILRAMKEHPKNAEVQQYAYGAWGSITHNFDNEVKIRDCGAIEMILQGMKEHLKCAEVQAYACRALMIISRNDEKGVKLADCDAIEMILQAMKEHPKNAEVQENACGALMSISCTDDDNKVKVAACGGIQMILQAMKEHPKNAEVQENACGALMNISCTDDDNKVKVAACGGIQMILQAMKEHLKIAEVQRNACGVLESISGNPDTKMKVAACGAIEILLQAMKEHPKNAEVQAHACRALGNICPNVKNRVKATDIQTIIKASLPGENERLILSEEEDDRPILSDEDEKLMASGEEEILISSEVDDDDMAVPEDDETVDIPEGHNPSSSEDEEDKPKSRQMRTKMGWFHSMRK